MAALRRDIDCLVRQRDSLAEEQIESGLSQFVTDVYTRKIIETGKKWSVVANDVIIGIIHKPRFYT